MDVGVLPQSTVPRRQSASSHDSPIQSPIIEDDSGIDQYKPYPYRQVCSAGLNTTFNSFPTPHHQSTSLPMANNMGYPNSPSAAYHSMYSAQDSMCSNGASALSVPVWR